jgi:hypothetical protein
VYCGKIIGCGANSPACGAWAIGVFLVINQISFNMGIIAFFKQGFDETGHGFWRLPFSSMNTTVD